MSTFLVDSCRDALGRPLLLKWKKLAKFKKILHKNYSHKLNVQLQVFVNDVLAEGVESFDLVVFVRWQDSQSKCVLGSVGAVFSEGGWKNSEAGGWDNLRKEGSFENLEVFSIFSWIL
jgi:hypothetical protein